MCTPETLQVCCCCCCHSGLAGAEAHLEVRLLYAAADLAKTRLLLRAPSRARRSSTRVLPACARSAAARAEQPSGLSSTGGHIAARAQRRQPSWCEECMFACTWHTRVRRPHADGGATQRVTLGRQAINALQRRMTTSRRSQGADVNASALKLEEEEGGRLLSAERARADLLGRKYMWCQYHQMWAPSRPGMPCTVSQE